jgi:uncharacterized membrane protein
MTGLGNTEMKAKGLALILLIIVAGFIPGRTIAASLRCGVRIITEGDYKDRVLAECGTPDHVEVWEEERVYRFQYHPGYYGIYDNYDYDPAVTEYGRPYRVKKLVIVEEWTYNHGPTRFLDHLRLENGIVKEIRSGDYGY